MEKFTVTSDELKAECLRARYAELLGKPEVFPSKANWDYIIEHKMEGLGPGLYRKYLVSWMLAPEERNEFNDAALAEFPRYLRTVTRQYAIGVVYGDITSAPEATVRLIAEAELFDAPRLMALLDTDRDFVIANLGAFQPEYDGDDADHMAALMSRLDALPRQSDNARGGLFNKLRHDKNAISEQQATAIDEFATRVEALKRLLG